MQFYDCAEYPDCPDCNVCMNTTFPGEQCDLFSYKWGEYCGVAYVAYVRTVKTRLGFLLLRVNSMLSTRFHNSSFMYYVMYVLIRKATSNTEIN